jgi:solute carrier family 44 (choline transporter-like protein), member 1
VVAVLFSDFLQLVLLLILLVMRKRIGLVVALFHEAGKCLASVPLLLIQPLWTFVVLFIFFVYWLIVMAYIATLGKLM